MLADLPRFPFTSTSIVGAPEDPGVFILWEGTEITRIGLAPSPEGGIKLELLDLLNKRRTCPCQPTHYSWLLSRDPLSAASGLMREHGLHFAELPRCNRHSSSKT